MELIRTIRERNQTKREQEMQQEMQKSITIADFADTLYIAYNDIPLFPIPDDWTPKDILQRLNSIRQVAANSKLSTVRNYCKLEDYADRS